MKLTTVKCALCSSGCCVCEIDGYWAAHCMLCDNAIGGDNTIIRYCAKSEYEATMRWNALNERLLKEM